MTWQENVEATLNAFSALRRAFVEDQLNGKLKPTYTVAGHSYDWVGYGQYQDEQINSCLKQLAQGEPFEAVSQGM